MKFFFFLCVVLFASSCGKTTVDTHHQKKPDWELADKIYIKEIEKKVFPQLKNEKRLYVCESGWGLRGREKIHVFHCGFDYYDEIDLKDARETILTAANVYLKAINENENIRPYLGHYPLKPENVEIRIFIERKDRSDVPLDKIQVISLIEGELKYKIGLKDSRGFLMRICEETYDEAMEKLSSGNIQMPL